MVKKVAGKYTEADYFQFRQADPNFSMILPQEQDLPITIDQATGTFYYATKNGIRSALSHKCLLLRSFFYEEALIDVSVKGLDYYQHCLYGWSDNELLLVKEGRVVERKELRVKKCKQGFFLLADGTLKKDDTVISENVINFDSNGSSFAYITGDCIKTESMEWNVAQATSVCVISSETVIVGTTDQVLLLTKDEIIDFGDPTNAYSGPNARYIFLHLLGWGVNQTIRQLIVIAHTLSADLALIAKLNDGTWTILNPSGDDALAQLPFTRGDGSDDQSPRQLLLDYTDSTPSPSPLPDGAPLPPSPILWVLTNEGTLCPFRLVNSACDQLHPLMHPIEKEYSTQEIEKMKELAVKQKNCIEEFQSLSPSSSFEVINNQEDEVEKEKFLIEESTKVEEKKDIKEGQTSLINAQKEQEPTERKEVTETLDKDDNRKTVDKKECDSERKSEKKQTLATSEVDMPAVSALIPKIEEKIKPTAVEPSHKIKVDLECQVRKEYSGYENNLSQLFCQLYINIQKDLESNYRKLEDLEAITEKCRQDFISDSIFQKQVMGPFEEQLKELKGLKGEYAAALVTLKKKGLGEVEERAFNELESIVKDANLYASLGGKCSSFLSLYQSTIKERTKKFSRLICTEQEVAASITPLPINSNIRAKEQVPLRKLVAKTKNTAVDEDEDESSTSSPPTSLTIGFSPVSETDSNARPIPMTNLPQVKVTSETKTFKIELETKTAAAIVQKPVAVPSPLAIPPLSRNIIPTAATTAKSSVMEDKKAALDLSKLTFGSSTNNLAVKEVKKEGPKEELKKETPNIPKISFSPVHIAEKEEAKKTSDSPKISFTPVKKEDKGAAAFDFTKLSFGTQQKESFGSAKSSTENNTKTSFTPFGAFHSTNEDTKKETLASPKTSADLQTSFTPFGAFPSTSAFGAKSPSLFPSASTPHSTSVFGQTVSPSSSTGFGLAFGQTSLPSNPFLKPPVTEAIQPTIFTGFANTSVNFAALANGSEPKKEDEKKDLPPSFTQFRG